MNLLIDSGNTYTKVALSDPYKIHKIVQADHIRFFHELNNEVKPVSVIISSVNKDVNEILAAFPDAKKVILSADTPVPIKNLYKTPSTLGMDRLADVVGAHSLFPKHACLCIDAGSCITYDIIDDQGRYLGGSISPGIEMRFKALHTFTAKLPLIQKKETVDLTGTTTETSILSGVQIGAINELEGFINDYKSKYTDLKIIITGGDAGFFESRIKDTIFAVPDLLFTGLKSILEYNAS